MKYDGEECVKGCFKRKYLMSSEPFTLWNGQKWRTKNATQALSAEMKRKYAAVSGEPRQRVQELQWATPAGAEPVVLATRAGIISSQLPLVNHISDK